MEDSGLTYKQVEDLKREVRVTLDMNMNSQPLAELGDVDTLKLDEIIESKLLTAVRMVEASASPHLIDMGLHFGDNIGWMERPGEGPGYIELPEDFLRLVSFQMSDWSKPVTSPITEDDPRYALQSSRYGGLRGNPQKPVVAIVHEPVGLVLEFYSCTAGAGVKVKQARYIPLPKIENGKIAISNKLVTAVVHQAASLVALSINEDSLAEKMQAICDGLKS